MLKFKKYIDQIDIDLEEIYYGALMDGLVIRENYIPKFRGKKIVSKDFLDQFVSYFGDKYSQVSTGFALTNSSPPDEVISDLENFLNP